MDYPELPDRLRSACEKLRRTSTPIADIIPMLQEAADQLDADRAQRAAPQVEAAPMPLDYQAMVRAAFERIGAAKGTAAATAFNNGARWAHSIYAQPAQAAPVMDAQPVAVDGYSLQKGRGVFANKISACIPGIQGPNADGYYSFGTPGEVGAIKPFGSNTPCTVSVGDELVAEIRSPLQGREAMELHLAVVNAYLSIKKKRTTKPAGAKS